MQTEMSESGSNLWITLSNSDVPTVMKGKLDNWECSNWSIEDWASKCQGIHFKFRSGCKSNIQQWETQNVYTQATLKDFLFWLNVSTSELSEGHPFKKCEQHSWCYSSYNYMAEVFHNVPDMLKIVDWGDFGLQGRGGYDSTLWIGSEGSNTPCHQDSYGSNIVAQLIGRKLWILYPPDDGDLLYPTRVPYEESSVFSSVNILQPDLITFPKFSKTKPYVVILNPGDALYVPPKWWHFVYCLDTAVSVNTWVEHELDDTWRLEEAVVRFLMTAFIPTFKENNFDWLNPTEEILSGKETTALLRVAMERAKSKKDQHSSENKSSSAYESIVLMNSTSVTQLSFGQFEELMSNHTNYKQLDGCHQENEMVRIVNSFLSSSVVKTVIENLGKV